jgi:hypothetical protein
MPLKGVQRDVCVKGLHHMSPDNVWTRPSDGSRYCRACKQVSRKAARPPKQPAIMQRPVDVPVEALDILYMAQDWADNETALFNDRTGQPISWADWIANQEAKCQDVQASSLQKR